MSANASTGALGSVPWGRRKAIRATLSDWGWGVQAADSANDDTPPESSRRWPDGLTGEPAPKGSVLVHSPSFAFQAPGGGENQLLQTSRHLHAMGVPVRPFSPWCDRLEGARLLHLYGMSREGLELARVAKAKGVPVVLSPICWFEPRALAALAPSRARGAIDLAKWAARRAFPRAPGWRRALLGLSDAILPNSRAEAAQLVRLFGADRERIQVVRNGVDPRFAFASPDLFHGHHGEGEFVLYVGRIEPRKNVLGLARAARHAGLPLVVIGAAVPGHEEYFDACRREGGPSALWLDRMEHEDPMLASAMAAARVFALPSWFETPGLAALEAATAGCSVAITPYGCTREYFRDQATYCPPGTPRRMARDLKRAWDAGPSAWPTARFFLEYRWSEIAIATRGVYDRASR